MLLAASNADHTVVELLTLPAGSKPGDRVFVEGHENVVPEPVLNPKKKLWETLKPDFKTNAGLVAVYQDKPLRTAHGHITVKSLVAANIQ